jgi:probable phosphoglycerate mutase
MRLIFTRHGESQANIQKIISNRDLPHQLTPLGISQSTALAETLQQAWQVVKIYASPIPWAFETGGILAEKLGIPMTVTPALREFDCGRMEGRGDEDAWRTLRGVIRAWDQDRNYDRRIEPDGESFNDMRARFLPFTQDIIEENHHLPGDIVLVSHGGLLHHMLPLVLSNLDRGFTRQHPLGNCQLVVVEHQDEGLVCLERAGIELI